MRSLLPRLSAAFACAALLSLAAAGCTGDRALPTASEGDTRIEALLIAPQSSAVVAGEVKKFAINARDFDGNYSVPGTGVEWDASIGRITGDGTYYAPETPGPVMIRAKYRGVGAATDLTVIPNASIASLEILPNTAEVQAGTSLDLTLVARTGANYSFYVRANWEAERGGLTVLNSDLSGVRAFSSGAPDPSAPGGAPGLAPSRILESDGDDVRAILLSQPQRVIYHAPQTPGSERVKAKLPLGGKEALFLAKIIPGPVAAVRIEPRRVTVAPGTTQVFAAIPVDRFGNMINGPVSWFASGGGIDQNGVYTAPTTGGETVISARYMGVSGTASVNNANIGAITSIAIRPLAPTLRLGEAQQFVATGTDEYGNTVNLVNPIWETNNGTIDGFGFYTTYGASVGPARIRVTDAGIVGETTATVTTWN